MTISPEVGGDPPFGESLLQLLFFRADSEFLGLPGPKALGRRCSPSSQGWSPASHLPKSRRQEQGVRTGAERCLNLANH